MPERYPTDQDKNFDDLVHHFKHNIYGRLKGKIRLAVIERDLAPYLKTKKVIVDAGGGQGQFSLSLAQRGHKVTLCDISEKMLELAKQNATEQARHNTRFIQCALQDLAEQLNAPADIVLCHAVMEWLAKPEDAISYLAKCVTSKGIVSLAFFNIDSIIFKNLIRANYRKVDANDHVGMEGSLTPINPLKKDTVFSWCKQAGFEIVDYSGIRVFHDYIIDPTTRNRHPEAAIDAELKYSQQEPYRSLGRYIHVVMRKS